MAYTFVSASSQYLYGNLVINSPLTLAIWARLNTVGSGATLLGRFASNDDRYSIALIANGSIFNPRASEIKDGVSSVTATNTSFSASVNEWVHVAGVFSSTNSRTVYANGSNAFTDTTAHVALNNSERVQIGASRGTSGNPTPNTVVPNTNGDLAEAGIWSAALTAAEILALGKGISPSLIRPQSLVFYAPLIRELMDIKNNLTLTNNNGATVSNHPRVYY